MLCLAVLVLTLMPAGYTYASCPDLINHSMKRLHSSENVDLCKTFSGKPLMIVNTASHCGFTYQFEHLEQVHQRYKPRGIEMLGVASDSFFQAAATEEKAAEVCYQNFGVSFTMLAPVPVKGDSAHPLFKQLAEATAPPQWNFYKYIVDRDGEVVARFGSNVKPDDPAITAILDNLASN